MSAQGPQPPTSLPREDRAGIEYEARAADGRSWRFVVDVDRDGSARKGALPVWTEMGHERCSDCPVEATHCPAAADIAPMAEAMRDVRSVERVDVTVRMAGREVHRSTDTQELVRSLIGVLLATSACPILKKMKPLARIHQPFASFDETLFRAVALHLVRAYFDKADGRPADFALDELRAHYADVARVNRALAKRLRSVAARDANVNGIVQLFSVCVLVADELDHRLDSLRALVQSDEPAPAAAASPAAAPRAVRA